MMVWGTEFGCEDSKIDKTMVIIGIWILSGVAVQLAGRTSSEVQLSVVTS